MGRREWLIAELTRLGRVATSIQQRYGAYLALHRAACINQDNQEMQQRREEIHGVVDALLDNGEAIQRLTDEMESTP